MIEIFKGDITTLSVDVIVNAANPQLTPGGGVCGAIHQAAGRKLAMECGRLIIANGEIPPGEIATTEAYDLRAKKVIHAVGPIYTEQKKEECELLLHQVYVFSLLQARILRMQSIAFPMISAGIYGFPAKEATRIAVESIRSRAKIELKRIILVAFDDMMELNLREAMA